MSLRPDAAKELRKSGVNVFEISAGSNVIVLYGRQSRVDIGRRSLGHFVASLLGHVLISHDPEHVGERCLSGPGHLGLALLAGLVGDIALAARALSCSSVCHDVLLI
jgi:hypothetical protein